MPETLPQRRVLRVVNLMWILLTAALLFGGCGGGGGDDDDDDSAAPSQAPDSDGDGVVDADDNCPDTSNADQADSNSDGVGDACTAETCDGVDNNGDGQIDEGFDDSDDDGILDCLDDCPSDPANDTDGDGVCGDVDNCPADSNADQADADGDKAGDACDACPEDPDDDADGDGVCGDVDNCPETENTEQTDTDSDGIGDLCDNCTEVENEDQTDTDSDGIGDACDNCPDTASEDLTDTDNDGFGDICDNCPNTASEDQTDTDGDGLGDVCDQCPYDPDNDVDGDLVCGDVDNCPSIGNPGQEDEDQDGMGDVCDPCPDLEGGDPDNDGACGEDDNCPGLTNQNQMDRDRDGVGDACDECPNDNPDDEDDDGVCGGEPPIENPDATFYYVDSYPGQGAQAIDLDPMIKVFFSEPYLGDEALIDARIVSQYSDQEDRLPKDSIYYWVQEDTEMRFYLDSEFQESTDYCLMVDIQQQDELNAAWPMHLTSCFTTRTPCGVTVDVGFDTSIQAIGATGPVGLGTLNTYLSETGNDFPVAFLMKDVVPTEEFPIAFDGALGAYKYDEDTGTNSLHQDGYGSFLPGCVVDDVGSLECLVERVTFPIYRTDSNTVTYIYISDVTIVAAVLSSGAITTFVDFLLSGIVTEDDIARLSSQTNYDLSSVIQLDLDTDGDGEEDAATIEIATVPQELVVEGASCTDD